METLEGGDTAETSRRDFNEYLKLYKAAVRGDWETANTLFFQHNRKETEAIISFTNETALHVAVQNGRSNDFVRNLARIMRPEALALRNLYGQTALHIVGNTEAAMCMLEINPDLLYMFDEGGRSPVAVAVQNRKRGTLEFLVSVSDHNVENSPFRGEIGFALLIETISSEFLDVALDLVYMYPDLSRLKTKKYYGGDRCALSFMAELENVFPSNESLSWWEKFIYRCAPVKQHESRSTFVSAAPTYGRSTSMEKQFKSMIWKIMEHLVPGVKDIKDKKQMHKQALELVNCLCREMRLLPENDLLSMLSNSMLKAAGHGISEIVQVIIDMFPVLASSVHRDYRGMSIMHLAATNRFENVFNLTYNMTYSINLLSDAVDSEGNNLLHMCGKRAPFDRLNIVPGAALQMQRELQWFNEIQKFVPPSHIKWQNSDGKTPKMLFTEEHQELKAQGEKWMKCTATACSIVTALIATVVFAAAFTVPGGVSSENGIPILSEEPAFILFATTNAVSLFTSITSLMSFLSILTSRYAQGDFLHVLPQRLSFGLLSLFVSVIFMLLAFSAALYLVFRKNLLYLVFRKNLLWFIIQVAAFGWWPLVSFVMLQFPLLVDVAYSTYGHGIFGNKTDPSLLLVYL